MNRCATCAHWAEGAQDDPAYGNCGRIGSADHRRFSDPEAAAFANSTEGMGGAWIETRAEFGCVLHEARPL